MDYKYETVSKVVQNASGHHLSLKIKHFQCGYEINIATTWSYTFQTISFLLLLLISIGVIDYSLEIYNRYHIIVLGLAIVVLINQLSSILRSEKLLVVKNVGYQIEKCYLFRKKHTFIPWNAIQSIFINEVITKQTILFVLTVRTLKKDGRSNQLFPLFEESKPKLHNIRDIYRMLKVL